MNKRILKILLVLILFTNTQIWALSVSDPNDPLYQLISGWEEKGYISNIPLLRPYPPQLIRYYLKEVIAKGTEVDRKLALSVQERLEGKRSLIHYADSKSSLSMNLEAFGELLASSKRGEGTLRPASAFSLGGDFLEGVTYSGRAALYMLNRDESLFTPHRQEVTNFFQSGIGATFSSDKDTYNFQHLWQGGLFFGGEDLYFQMGMMRSSFGPFFENGLVIGPQAPEAGHFSLTYTGKWFSFSSLFMQLIAKYAAEKETSLHLTDPIYNLKGNTGSFPEKYLVIHSFDFHPFDWLSVGLIQSVLFGGRFDPLYLIPFQILSGTQTYTGDWDDSYVGIYSTIHPLKNLNLNFLIYVDDLNLNEMLKLNFNSNQNKFALQTGIAWIPELPLFIRLSLDYLLVTPYMYTHSSHQTINYLTYTHNGSHLGSVLEPNSDQLTVKTFMMINEWIQGALWGRYSRHGNGSDHGSGSVDGDGSIWDDGYTDGGGVTFYGESTFLTQDIIEKVFQLGLSVDVSLPVKIIDIILGGEYIFEYIMNKELVKNASETNHYLKLQLGIRL